MFEESIAETLDRYVEDERIKHALFGQGVIGTNAGPRDPGTASVRLMHHQGDLLGLGSSGGMSGVGWAASRSRSPRLRCRRRGDATGAPVGRIVPGEGVELESGERLRAPGRGLQRGPQADPGDAGPGGGAGSPTAERIEALGGGVAGCEAECRAGRLPTFPAARGWARIAR